MAQYEQSIVDVVKGAVRDAQDLLRSEIALAKSELKQEGRRLGMALAMLAAAAVCAALGLVLLLTTVAWALTAAFAWPVWIGFAIVTVIALLAAVVLAGIGRRRLVAERHLPMTMDTLKENAEWIRQRTS